MLPPNPSDVALAITALSSGAQWTGGRVTFSFATHRSNWSAYDEGGEPFSTGFGTFGPAQQAAARRAMAAWDELIAPGFWEVTEPGSAGDIRFAFTDLGPYDGLAYYPSRYSEVAGDVWIDDGFAATSFAVGSAEFELLLHEIGHALGLRHPFEGPVTLPEALDDTSRTVMSYTPREDLVVIRWQVTAGGATWSVETVQNTGPALFDILAMQAIYGADTATRADDTTYTIDPASGSMRTLYDAGGTDAIDLSGASRPSRLDLRGGAFSDVHVFTYEAQLQRGTQMAGWWNRPLVQTLLDAVGPDLFTWTNNLAIAYGTVIENAFLGDAADLARGNAAGNRLHGAAGADTLIGDGGDDTLKGGSGGDRLEGGEGVDQALYSGAAASYAVTALPGGMLRVQDLRAGSPDGADTLSGIERLRFSDTVLPAVVPILGTAGADSLVGGAEADMLHGLAGADTLSGGAGRDTLAGGEGNDTYLLGDGDQILEQAGGGTDLVRATVSTTLADGVERLLLLGEARTGTGNALANLITGHAGANTLAGADGHDTLDGGGGNDSLEGGTGADLLRGDEGADTLRGGGDRLEGGAGNDTYILAAPAVVVEAPAAGRDRVVAAISWTLGEEIEELVLIGSAAAGAGNASANLLRGSGGPNRLEGMGGNDRLEGEAGDDTLAGGTGRDTLAGGAGNDAFRWSSAGDGGDLLADYDPARDVIEVSATGFGGGLAPGMDLGAAGRYAATIAGGATSAPGTGQFVLETDRRILWWDADGSGSGARVAVLTLNDATGFAAAEIRVIA